MRLCLTVCVCVVLGSGCSSAGTNRPASTGGSNSPALNDSGTLGADARAAPHDAGVGSSTGGDAGGDAGDVGPPRACPNVENADNAGALGPASLNEASGLVASRTYPSVLWLHNDSGDRARIFATRTDGVALSIVEVTGADAVDWEDIAIGPGPVAGKTYLYVGDIGDNGRQRKDVQIYRMEEPVLDANGKATSGAVAAERIDVRYEDGAHDAETLLVDPIRGDLYIVEKGLMRNGVYRIPAPAAGASSVTAKRVAKVSLMLANGGDVLPQGNGLAVRNYGGVSYWPRDPALPLETAFEAEPCELKLAAEQQGEALGFFADGEGYYTVSEGEGAILHSYKFAVSSKSR